MAQTTPPIEKRRNYPGLISLCCEGLAFIFGYFFFVYQNIYNESLFTNDVAGFFYNVFGTLWSVFIALGLLCWFVSLFLILPIWEVRYRATGIILGIVFPLVQVSIVAPAQGLPRSIIYYKVSDPAAVQHLRDIIQNKERIDPTFLEDTYEQDYSELASDQYQTVKNNTETIVVKYKMRHSIERNDLPKSFIVIIDRKTKKTEIKHENDVQQKAE
jgi:hypothetical protein